MVMAAGKGSVMAAVWGEKEKNPGQRTLKVQNDLRGCEGDWVGCMTPPFLTPVTSHSTTAFALC